MRRKFKKTSGGLRNPQDQVIRLRGSCLSLRVDPTNASMGLLNSGTDVETGIGVSSQAQLYLDPLTVGGSLFNFSEIFTWYKINSVTLRYIPVLNDYGGSSSSAAAVTGNTVNVESSQFVMAFQRDPAGFSLTFKDLINCGGKVVNCAKRTQITMKGNFPWLYCDASGAMPSIIDQRMTAFGILACMLPANWGHADTVIWGYIQILWDASFKGQRNLTSLAGVARVPRLSLTDQVSKPEQKKSESDGKDQGKAQLSLFGAFLGK